MSQSNSITSNKAAALAFRNLADWSDREFSWLPWRKNRTLYTTLVSEIMLQQTTVSTVLKHFERFLEEYPDPYAIAKASDEQLTISWKGLGYYRRARNLKKACAYFCDHHQGEIPLDYHSLIQAPGVGDYTANAILAIGADKRAIALDANLERVLSRLYCIEILKGPKLLKNIQSRFAQKEICQELDSVGARAFNEALMDLGRNYCKANKASCELCPLSAHCAAFQSGRVLEIPVKPKSAKSESFNLSLLRLLCFKGDELLVFKKNEKQWLAGQYEVPTFILDSEDPKLTQYPLLAFENHHLLPEYKTLITKYKITNKVLIVDESDLKRLKVDYSAYEWKSMTKESNLSTASTKALALLD